ncbi:MAG: LysR substrate-binding domain-containing protein [Magnetovibrio sp.]|nr:LysR substrate-binding domain-containing protein [Magnetovibrio sp.]
MRPTQLRAFHAVARDGGFSAAAERLGLTQPALTIQVRNLERTYGLRLFERAGDGVRLTGAGRELFRLTGEFFGVQDRIAAFLSASRDLETGELNLAADGPHLAAQLIAAFRARYPAVRVSLALGNASEVWRDLAENRADAVIAAAQPADPANHVVALGEGRLVMLAAAGHGWADRGRIAIGELQGADAVLRERLSNTRRTVNRALREAGVSLGRVLELDSREAVVEAVAAGLGVGFVFSSEVTPDPRVRAVDLDGVAAVNREVVACLNSRRGSHVVRAFLDVAADWRASGA